MMFPNKMSFWCVLLACVLSSPLAGCSDDEPERPAPDASTEDVSDEDASADVAQDVSDASDATDAADTSDVSDASDTPSDTSDVSSDVASDADTSPDADGSPDADSGGSSALVWAKHLGDEGAEGSGDVVVDAQGNVIATGHFSTGSFATSVDFGGGGLTSAGWEDVFLVKYDAGGNHLWSKSFGGGRTDAANALTVDPQGNIVLAGYFSETADFGGGGLTSAGYTDMYVAKYDADGNHLWSKRFGSTGSDGAQAVAIDSQGAVIVTGYFRDTVDFGGGPLVEDDTQDGFIAKFDADGNHVWSRRFGAAGVDDGLTVAVDSSDNIIFGGRFSQTVNLGGADLTSGGNTDAFVAKWDADANHLWSHGFGHYAPDATHALAVDSQDNVVLAGYFDGEADFGGGTLFTDGGLTDTDIFVARFDSAGSHLWSKNFGGGRWDIAVGVGVDSQDNVFMTGRFQGTVDFGGGSLTGTSSNSNAFVVGFDTSGGHLWSNRYGGTDHTSGAAVVASAQDEPVVLGTFTESVDFGAGSWTQSGNGADIFLLVLPTP